MHLHYNLGDIMNVTKTGYDQPQPDKGIQDNSAPSSSSENYLTGSAAASSSSAAASSSAASSSKTNSVAAEGIEKKFPTEIKLQKNRITIVEGDSALSILCKDVTNCSRAVKYASSFGSLEFQRDGRTYHLNKKDIIDSLKVTPKLLDRIAKSESDTLTILQKIAFLRREQLETLRENFVKHLQNTPNSQITFLRFWATVNKFINTKLEFKNNDFQFPNVPTNMQGKNNNLYIHVSEDRHFNVWELSKELGSGGAGTVYESLQITSRVSETPKNKAVKVKKPSNRDLNGVRNGEHSARVLTDLNSDQKYIKTLVPAPTFAKGHIEVMKLFSGDLTSPAIRKAIKKLEAFEVVEIVENLLETLLYIHKTKNYYYCDIKPPNMLAKLDRDGKIKRIVFADFDGVLKSDAENSTVYLVHTKQYLPNDASVIPGEKYAENVAVYAFSKTISESFGTRLPENILNIFRHRGMTDSYEHRPSLEQLKAFMVREIGRWKTGLD